VYPALAVLSALRAICAEIETQWVGGIGGMEVELVKREGIPFEAIPAAGVHGVGLRALPGNVFKLGRGWLASRRILERFRPQVLLFTGGYVAVPMSVAARLQGRRRPKSLLYVPDIEPGLALKTLARFADHIAVTTETSRRYFSPHTPLTVTGYPLRASLQPLDRSQARRTFGLHDDLPTLLVLGGSKGARAINRAILSALPQLLVEMQVLHISGELDWPEIEAAARTLPHAPRYRPYPYLHEEMAAAFSAADLVVSRAGASTLGELPHFGLPAILVPYPYAWRYQRVNAAFLEQRGAAIVIENAALPQQLLPAVHSLMHDPHRRAAMQQAMRHLARPDAAMTIARLLLNLADSQEKVA